MVLQTRALTISALVNGEMSNLVHMPTHAMSPVQFKHFSRRKSRRVNEHFNIQIRVCVLLSKVWAALEHCRQSVVVTISGVFSLFSLPL